MQLQWKFAYAAPPGPSSILSLFPSPSCLLGLPSLDSPVVFPDFRFFLFFLLDPPPTAAAASCRQQGTLLGRSTSAPGGRCKQPWQPEPL